MKRETLFIAAICSAFVIGCGSGNGTVQLAEHKTQYKPQPNKAVSKTPESIAANLESTQERARYLRELSKDAGFDPKKHVDMLKRYASDADPEVAGAANELLAKAQ